MSMTEFNQVASETFGNPNPFLVENSSETFLEIYDTVKNHVDSSMIYELTLVNLKRDEIWLDLKVPQGNMKNLEKIGCIIMNSHFSELVPEQIKIRLFERVNSLEIGRTRYIITGIKKVN